MGEEDERGIDDGGQYWRLEKRGRREEHQLRALN